jgi:hypothetical protein
MSSEVLGQESGEATMNGRFAGGGARCVCAVAVAAGTLARSPPRRIRYLGHMS